MVPGSVSDAPEALRDRFDEMDVARPLRGAARRGHPGRGRPLRDAQRDPHEPRDDHEPAGAHPHVRAAAVHDGPMGDPPALPAHPPRVFTVSPFLGSFLAPKCVPLGYCDEDRNRDEHCPIRPHKDTVLGAWAEKAAAAKADRRELPTLWRRGRRGAPRPARARARGDSAGNRCTNRRTPRQARAGLVGGEQDLLVSQRRR